MYEKLSDNASIIYILIIYFITFYLNHKTVSSDYLLNTVYLFFLIRTSSLVLSTSVSTLQPYSITLIFSDLDFYPELLVDIAEMPEVFHQIVNYSDIQ